MSEDVALARRGRVPGLLLNMSAALWALAVPPLVWGLGLVLWHEVTSCPPPSSPTTIALTCGLTLLALGAGAVPGLVTRAGGWPWLAWVTLLLSLGVLALYTMIMVPAVSFGLSGHPDRLSRAVVEVFVSYVPSLAVAGSAALSLLAKRFPRGVLVALSSWAIVIIALALGAAFAARAMCGIAL